LADINGDGRLDGLANSDKAGLFWYEIPDDPTRSWRAHLIVSAETHKMHGGVSPKAVGDIDGDGDADVVTGQAWYESADGGGLHWKAHQTISLGETHQYGIALKTWVIDLDGDGDPDVVQAEADNPDSRVAWFENNGRGDGTRHMIKDKGDQQDFHTLVVADFDGDGAPTYFRAVARYLRLRAIGVTSGKIPSLSLIVLPRDHGSSILSQKSPVVKRWLGKWTSISVPSPGARAMSPCF
jgi:hypothetical protein